MLVADAFEKIRVNPGNFADGRKTFEEINYDDPAEFEAEKEHIREVRTPLATFLLSFQFPACGCKGHRGVTWRMKQSSGLLQLTAAHVEALAEALAGYAAAIASFAFCDAEHFSCR